MPIRMTFDGATTVVGSRVRSVQCPGPAEPCESAQRPGTGGRRPADETGAWACGACGAFRRRAEWRLMPLGDSTSVPPPPPWRMVGECVIAFVGDPGGRARAMLPAG